MSEPRHPREGGDPLIVENYELALLESAGMRISYNLNPHPEWLIHSFP